MKYIPTFAAIFGLAFMLSYCAIRVSNAVTPAEELQIASAYHCGVLDALQEKRNRGRACDTYKAIAKKRGVDVPP